MAESGESKTHKTMNPKTSPPSSQTSPGGWARPMVITSTLIAMALWIPGLFDSQHPIKLASLLGFLPSEIWHQPNNQIWLLFPFAGFSVVAWMAWSIPSRVLAVCLLATPFVGAGLFLLRFGMGMGAFR